MNEFGAPGKKGDRTLASISGWGIFLVVLGHSSGATPEQAIQVAGKVPSFGFYWAVLQWIYTFHMPLFFALSGFLYIFSSRRKESSPGYWEFVRGKAWRLLLPYGVISSVAFPIKTILSRFAARPLDLSWWSYVESLIYPWRNTIVFYWFLPTLFGIFCLAPLLKIALMKGGVWGRGVVTAVTIGFYLICPDFGGIQLFNINGVFKHLFFFWMGMELAYWQPTIRWQIWTAVLGILSVTLFIGFGTGNPGIKWILGGLGVLFSFGLSHLWSARWQSIWAFLGDYSFTIYLYSWFSQTFCRVLFYQVLGLGIGWTAAAMFLSGILFPLLVGFVGHRYVSRRWRPLVGLQG